MSEKTNLSVVDHSYAANVGVAVETMEAGAPPVGAELIVETPSDTLGTYYLGQNGQILQSSQLDWSIPNVCEGGVEGDEELRIPPEVGQEDKIVVTEKSADSEMAPPAGDDDIKIVGVEDAQVEHRVEVKTGNKKPAANACDCLMSGCPGCHYPCKTCGSRLCGHECRIGRDWSYEEIEIEGWNITRRSDDDV